MKYVPIETSIYGGFSSQSCLNYKHIIYTIYHISKLWISLDIFQPLKNISNDANPPCKPPCISTPRDRSTTEQRRLAETSLGHLEALMESRSGLAAVTKSSGTVDIMGCLWDVYGIFMGCLWDRNSLSVMT